MARSRYIYMLTTDLGEHYVFTVKREAEWFYRTHMGHEKPKWSVWRYPDSGAYLGSPPSPVDITEEFRNG